MNQSLQGKVSSRQLAKTKQQTAKTVSLYPVVELVQALHHKKSNKMLISFEP